MANPCDKRVQQLTASITNLNNVVSGLNTQVSEQMLELDTARAAVDAALAAVAEKQSHIDVQTQVIQNQQNELTRLQALLDQQQPPPPPQPPPQPVNTQPESIEVDVRGGEGGWIKNEPRD